MALSGEALEVRNRIFLSYCREYDQIRGYVDLFEEQPDNVVELRPPRARPPVDVLIDHIDGEWPKLDAKGRRTLIKYLARLFGDLHWADDDE